MAYPSPLQSLHDSAEPLIGQYGTPERAIPVVQAFDPIEVEYAAIRRHAAIIDRPERATLILSGADRLDFLNRMVTQDLRGLRPFQAVSSFWLSRKGRIDADLRIMVLPESIVLDVDVFAAQRTLDGLRSYIVSEDCSIDDATEYHHRLSVHGPAAAALLARLADQGTTSGASIAEIAPNQVCNIEIGDIGVSVDRCDSAGTIGLELLMRAYNARWFYDALSTPWSARGPGDAAAPQTDLARRIGWHAYNIARIEAGTALYLLDFGPDSLPHETGDATLADRVSFKKGCYLGQEIVARMQSLGHPKQKLVGLRLSGGHMPGSQPGTGAAVLDADKPDAPTIGAVTSSAFSPMNSGDIVCFAMVKYSHAVAGTKLHVTTTAGSIPAIVQPTLSFLRPT